MRWEKDNAKVSLMTFINKFPNGGAFAGKDPWKEWRLLPQSGASI